MLLVFFVLIFPPAAAGTEHFVLRSDNSNFILTDVTADKHFINIRMTLEVSPASLLFSPLKSLGLSYPCFIFLPPLQVQHHHLSFSTPTFLYICSFFSSSLGPYQPTMHWSHVIPSLYHLLTIHYSTLSPPTTEITAPLSFLLYHPSYVFSPSSPSALLPSPPSTPGYVPHLHCPPHPPHHLQQYLYVLDVLYSIKAVC